MRAWEMAAVSALAAWLGGCSPETFACSNASQCMDGGIAGVCEPSGYCSFPDGSCETGQRYGDLAPTGLANTCVPPGGMDSQTGVDTNAGTSSASSSTGTAESTDSGLDGSTDDSGSAGSDAVSDGGATGDCPGADCPVDCADRWIVEYGTQPSSIRFDTTGNLLVTGSEDADGLVSRISTCGGGRLASISLPVAGADHVRPMEAEPTDELWVVVGNRVFDDGGVREAFVAQLGLEDLTPQRIETLPSPMEEAWSVALLGNTRWTVGVSNFAAGMQQPFMAHTSAAGKTCGFAVDPAGFGFTRAMAVYGPDVYVAGAVDSRAYVARFDSQACGPNPCACAPDWSMDFAIEPQYNEIRGLVMHNGTLYAGGYSVAVEGDFDFQGFVARIEPPSTEVAQLWTYDPTPLFDAVIELSIEGDTLFAPMTTSYDFVPQDYTAAVGVVAALPLDLEQPATWIAEVPQVSTITDVVANGESVYLSARRDADVGYVVKCTRDGACP